MIQRAIMTVLDLDDRRRRWLCARFGHRLAPHGVPELIEFPACRRCRKWGREVVNGEIRS